MALCTALFTLTVFVACGNECSFWERCRGNILEICGEGPDQMFGRKINSFPCEQPNPVCIELPGEHAMCVTDPVTACDDTFDSYCKGNVLYACAFVSAEKKGYVTGIDCSKDKNYDGSGFLQCIEDEKQGSACR